MTGQRAPKTAVRIDLFRIQQTTSAAVFDRVHTWVRTALVSGIASEEEKGLAWAATVRLWSTDDAEFARGYMLGFGAPASCVRLVAP